MAFNAENCFVLNITRKRNPSKNKYYLKGQVLQVVKTTTYLDVEISDNHSWSQHISKIIKKANKSLGFLRRNSVTNNSQVKTQAYTSLVRALVEYGCSVWDPHKQGHSRTAKFISSCVRDFNLKVQLFNSVNLNNLTTSKPVSLFTRLPFTCFKIFVLQIKHFSQLLNFKYIN